MYFVLLATLIVSLQLNAEEMAPRWNLGLGIGPNITNADAVGDELNSSVGAALWLSREWGEFSRLDLSFDYFKFEKAGQDYPSLNVAYGFRFFRASRFKPFVVAGLGVGQANKFPYAVDRQQKVFNLFARGGVDEIFSGERWSLGLMVDFEHLFMDGKPITSAQLALPMLTFVWRFANDKEDPAPARIDSDKDGVYDDKDECPNTARGKRVNSIGCELKQQVTKTLKVGFETASDVIRPAFLSAVDEFGDFMVENSDLQLSIEGHTDSVGSRAYNTALSQRRADAVRRALIERKQIDPSRIKAKGYGPDKPIADNQTPQGRQLNRRVTAVLATFK